MLKGYNLPRLPGQVSRWGGSLHSRLLWADNMLAHQMAFLDMRLGKLPNTTQRFYVLERLRIVHRQKLICQLRAKIDRYALHLTGAQL